MKLVHQGFSFPHPVTLCGLLEMGSMYLPVNNSWVDFQDRANQTYDDLNNNQRTFLQRLAEEALQKHNGEDKSYERDPWLWDLDWSKPKKASNVSPRLFFSMSLFLEN